MIFLPKCRVLCVDLEKGLGAGKKGMALEKKGMARRHSKSSQGKHYTTCCRVDKTQDFVVVSSTEL